MLPILPPPTWPGPSRHLLSQLPAVPELSLAELTGIAAAAELPEVPELSPAELTGAGTAAAGLDDEYEDYEEAEGELQGADPAAASLGAVPASGGMSQLVRLQNVGADDWFPNPLPLWSYNCMPW